MKLYEYLKQFEGLDPNIEVFVNTSEPTENERKAIKLNYCPFQFGYVHRSYVRDVVWKENQSFQFHEEVLILL